MVLRCGTFVKAGNGGGDLRKYVAGGKGVIDDMVRSFRLG